MSEYTIKIKLMAPCIIGAGEGFGSIIDTDIVYDDVGIPWIPAKRVKGCLRDAAIEVEEMYSKADIKGNGVEINSAAAFGTQGNIRSAPIFFSNLYIEQYGKTRQWLTYAIETYSTVVSQEQVLNTFTFVRSKTAMEDGVAKEHSLRTVRMVKGGISFVGRVSFARDDPILERTLFMACLNFRKMGTNRNRLSKVRCRLYKGKDAIDLLEEIRNSCIN
jgi:CRISPR/Cas system CSM-associated protein Csm3 (group 7 of RAMP superfamily)